MRALGLTPRFLVWAALTWLLTGLAISIGAALGEGWRLAQLYFLLPLRGPGSLATLMGVSLVVWVLSWIVGRMKGQPDQVNALISALSVGMANWVLQAFGILYPTGNPLSPGTITEPTRALSAGLGLAAVPIFLGPAMAWHVFRGTAR